ncbi:hypothetical protein FRC03_000726 [Tulasnella sp. 419]|nr:hypothetical protein FRC03_000726 [Tulasnella sp. 419]
MASRTWRQRYERLKSLFAFDPVEPTDDATGDVDSVGLLLDRFLDNKPKGASTRTKEVENARFSNRDLIAIGTLAKGQFGLIDLVRCRMDGCMYVRKTVTKQAAVRYREQCSICTERALLQRARQLKAVWVPYLLCSFQTNDDLNLVMEFAEGGSLSDVLGSAPSGRLEEPDLRWWIAQAVCAVSWCHSQGFVHRDIKPENFVLTTSAHLKLIDFGCAAQLQPPNASGVQLVPKPLCLVPCGTCDYLAPEILQTHEDILMATGLGESIHHDMTEGGYGKEVDWWSLGAMAFELGTGEAPFFAKEIRQTYQKIVEFEKHPPRFRRDIGLSKDFEDLIRGFLCHFEDRLGRRSIFEIENHQWFRSVKWRTLHLQPAPASLITPRFDYASEQPPQTLLPMSFDEPSSDLPFTFSVFFNSSVTTLGQSTNLRTPAPATTPAPNVKPPGDKFAAFLGFTWGPPPDAFDHIQTEPSVAHHLDVEATPGFPNRSTLPPTPRYSVKRPTLHPHRLSDPNPQHSLFTPIRPSLAHHPTTVPRTGLTATARRIRDVSDLEAMRQMMACVGMSARKKVLESGKKPRPLSAEVFSAWRPTDLRPVPALDVMKNVWKKDVPNPLKFSTSGDSVSGESAPPSPTPRPGSAMSKRSGTPGPTATFRSGTPAFTTFRSMTPGLTPTFRSHPRSFHISDTSGSEDGRERSNVSWKGKAEQLPIGEPTPRKVDLVQKPKPLPKQSSPLPASNIMVSDPRFDDLDRRLETLMRDIRSAESKLVRAQEVLKAIEFKKI